MDYKKSLNFSFFWGTLWVLLLFLLIFGVFFKVQENVIGSDGNIDSFTATSESTDSRIAPGEFLPISIKLVNFGSQKRIDVEISCQISNDGSEQIYEQTETVAVDTTASFIKRIQLPYAIKPGIYTVICSLNYPYQQSPAVSKFPILVEEKIAGIFKSDLILYSTMFVSTILIIIFFTWLFVRWNSSRRIIFYDYSNKPKDQVIYYEILSDIISQMRLRIGNKALEIAKTIPELKINDKNGLVLNIKDDPAKIVALLVSKYEKLSGRRVSFALRPK